jgi:S-formylglutathione hydrolase
MTGTEIQRFDVPDPNHGAVPCAVLLPPMAAERSALCLFLYGGGGSRENLADIAPLLEQGFRSGALPAMVVATPGVGPWSFYLDDPARGFFWESFIVQRFIPHLRATFAVQEAPAGTGLVGISMGGYGALKLAFGRPDAFGAVCAISPMIEPSFEAEPVRPRNRFFYPAGVPEALLGSARDAELYRRDHPASRARDNADALRASPLAIAIDAAGQDLFNAHDGAEFLHRCLWQLDIAHDYRLRREADHVGHDMPERLRDAFAWVGARLQLTAAELPPLERAWQSFLSGASSQRPASPPPATSPVFAGWLRAQFALQRTAAEAQDPTLARRYGI